MFFARIPILVEGLEDASYITTELHLSDQWSEFRRLGCHIIPVNNKSNLIQPLAIAKELNIPAFVLFDADGDTTRPEHRTKHELDNNAILHLLGVNSTPFPDAAVHGKDHAVWATNLGDAVKADFGADFTRYAETARAHYAHEGGIEKHDLFIADLLTEARNDNKSSTTLAKLCSAILKFAKQEAHA